MVGLTVVNDVELGSGRVRPALATPVFIYAIALLGFVVSCSIRVRNHCDGFDIPAACGSGAGLATSLQLGVRANR